MGSAPTPWPPRGELEEHPRSVECRLQVLNLPFPSNVFPSNVFPSSLASAFSSWYSEIGSSGYLFVFF